jgi:hypothetical protein
MRAQRTADAVFTATFESEEELRQEHRLNLSQGALRLPTAERVALHTTLLVTLRGPWGGEAHVRATAVAALPDGIALALAVDGKGNADEILQRLLAHKPELQQEPAPETDEAQKASAAEGTQNTWDRVRALSQMEKLLLAVKADRAERALLLQDNDPRVLLSLLRNPRLTVDEVARLAKSSFLTYQVADVITKAAQWMSSLDVRLGLIHNPKTPPAFAVRILPTLPENDVRAIARAGTTMALKQAALRRLQGK